MVDLLAVCAHPDDLEICAGGIFLKAKKEGMKTGLVILTDGAASGRSEAEARRREAFEGANRLGLDYFVQLDFPDAALEFNQDTVRALIPHLRKTAPRLLFTLHRQDYHPDHVAAGRITEAAAFSAGLPKYAEDGGDWHYDAILYFSADQRTNPERPQVQIDITDVMEEKLHAVNAHTSQNVGGFARIYAETLGRIAGVRYAEGLYLGQPLVMGSVKGLFKHR